VHVHSPRCPSCCDDSEPPAAAWLFDLDGTLVDTSPLHERAFRAALARRHAALLPAFDYRRIAGLTTGDVFRTLVPEEEIDELTRRKRSAFREELARTRNLAFSGAGRLLARLREAGIRVVIVTGSTRAGALATLEAAGLDRRVDALVTAEDAPRGKPNPEPFLRALAIEGLAPRRHWRSTSVRPRLRTRRDRRHRVILDPTCTSFRDLESLGDATDGAPFLTHTDTGWTRRARGARPSPAAGGVPVIRGLGALRR
jgi:beta-phosphoglucomutase-like phosphatase (HAD superfamily)